MKIGVIDGQGGGMGKTVIAKLRAAVTKEQASIIALGTNSTATEAMLKAGADCGATGENAVIYNARRCDVIIGAIGIIAANSFMGEMSPAMAAAVADNDALKILIPISKCHLMVAGTKEAMISVYIDDAIELLKAKL
jgi:hypothetical protein